MADPTIRREKITGAAGATGDAACGAVRGAWELGVPTAPVGVLKLAAKALSGNVSLNRRISLRGQGVLAAEVALLPTGVNYRFKVPSAGTPVTRPRR